MDTTGMLRPEKWWWGRAEARLSVGWIAWLAAVALNAAGWGLIPQHPGWLAALYLGAGFGLVKWIAPRLIEWADMPTPMLAGAKVKLMLFWPWRWAGMMLFLSWMRLVG